MTDSLVIHTILISDSEDDGAQMLDFASRIQKKRSILSTETKKSRMEPIIPSNGILSDDTIMNFLEDDNDMSMEIEAPISKPKIAKKIRKAAPKSTSEKDEKRRQREAKKRENENDKLHKQKERAANKAMKPEESIKMMVVHIDRRLLEVSEGSDIIKAMASTEIQYKVADHRVPFLVSFTRKDVITKEEVPEPEHVVLIPKDEFLSAVECQIYETDGVGLVRQCDQWARLLGPNLTILTVGLNEHYRNQKTVSNRNFKKKAGANFATNSRSQMKSDSSRVTRLDVESALVALQIESNVNHRLVGDPSNLAEYLVHFVKSIAVKPSRLEKEVSNGEFNWYVEGSNINTVKIDKTGVGLLKLWHQQLRQFNNVGVEVAQAIAKQYGSPQALVQEYTTLEAKEASLLLANIQVRRGHGVLVNTQRVGPELSKKIYKFFMNEDPNVNLSN